jgi:hypothetical protein
MNRVVTFALVVGLAASRAPQSPKAIAPPPPRSSIAATS